MEVTEAVLTLRGIQRDGGGEEHENSVLDSVKVLQYDELPKGAQTHFDKGSSVKTIVGPQKKQAVGSVGGYQTTFSDAAGTREMLAALRPPYFVRVFIEMLMGLPPTMRTDPVPSRGKVTSVAARSRLAASQGSGSSVSQPAGKAKTRAKAQGLKRKRVNYGEKACQLWGEAIFGTFNKVNAFNKRP